MAALVHIGIGKTGTTSIQSFLASNGSHLAARGVLYPVAGRIGNTHYGFFDVETGKIDEQAFEKLEAEVGSSQCERIMISSESLIYAPPMVIDRIRAALGADTRVLVYVREQLGLISSVFLQWVKVGTGYEGEISRFLEVHKASFDYAKLIAPWADAFGASHIEAHVYDKAIIGGSIVDHFLGVVGLAEITSAQEHYNPSLLPEFFAAIKHLDDEGIAPSARQQIVEHLLSASVSLRRCSTMSLITSETHERIRSLYSESNSIFAEQYLPEAERPFLQVRSA